MIHIVDAMCGMGKTSAAINYINNTSDEERIIYITPYLDEIKRIISSCPTKNIQEPKIDRRKFWELKQMIDRGVNIATTHVLFGMFDREVIDLCKFKNYTLILDEVADVVDTYSITKDDCKTLLDEYVDVDPETKILHWRDNQMDYKGKFDEEKRLCDLNALAMYGDSIMMWMFPIEAFKAFNNAYILTYMFESQIQKYYYDYHNVEYKYINIIKDDNNYYFGKDNEKSNYKNKINYSKLINILEHDKLNLIGDDEKSLSKSWYHRNCRNSQMKQLSSNINNFFRNIAKGKTSDNLWTTFKEYKNKLTGKGYSKGFESINMRATNKHMNRKNVAYMVNRYINPMISQFFVTKNIEIDEDGYALSEMIQFIWRSAIRRGNPITVYIPSKRMRCLLMDWIERNSITNETIRNLQT